MPPSYDVILQYLAGNLSGKEAEEIRRYFESTPELRGVHAGLRLVMQTDILNQPPETDAEVVRLLQRIGREQEATKRHRPAETEDTLLPTTSHVFTRGLPGGQRPSWGYGMRIALAIGVAVIASIGIMKWKQPATRVINPTDVAMRELTTQRGQLMTMELSDGTSVTLAPQTRLKISSTFGKDHRDVVLDGEAYFKIASRPDLPFVVRTKGSQIRVLGTKFDVRAYDTTTVVAVSTGKVSLMANRAMAPSLIVTANHVGVIEADGDAHVRQDDMVQYTGWVEGRLVFHGTPIPEVLDRLGRWYGVQITTKSTKLLSKQLFTDWQDRSLENSLQVLSEALGARIVRVGDQITLYAR
jgi:ferric-dicitrate binding protein FerR (iron transport regulator)